MAADWSVALQAGTMRVGSPLDSAAMAARASAMR
jgi:hypothetical protein